MFLLRPTRSAILVSCHMNVPVSAIEVVYDETQAFIAADRILLLESEANFDRWNAYEVRKMMA